jgi:hypothetical protein
VVRKASGPHRAAACSDNALAARGVIEGVAERMHSGTAAKKQSLHVFIGPFPKPVIPRGAAVASAPSMSLGQTQLSLLSGESMSFVMEVLPRTLARGLGAHGRINGRDGIAGPANSAGTRGMSPNTERRRSRASSGFTRSEADACDRNNARASASPAGRSVSGWSKR